MNTLTRRLDYHDILGDLLRSRMVTLHSDDEFINMVKEEMKGRHSVWSCSMFLQLPNGEWSPTSDIKVWR